MDNVNEMLKLLGPTDKLHWDILLYTTFFFNLVLLFVLPDGSTLPTFLTIVVLVCAVIDKTYAFGYMMDSGTFSAQDCHAKIFIGTYLIRAAMFIAPFTIAGGTDEGKVRALGILCGIVGVGYMGARWFIEQREVAGTNITCASLLNARFLWQSAGMVLVLARIVLRDRLSVGTIYRHGPILILRHPGADHVEIELA